MVEVDTQAERLFFTTVLITGEGPGGVRWTGTGFLYSIQVEGFPNRTSVVVSNKHVFQNATALTFRMTRLATNLGPDIGKSVQVTVSGGGVNSWAGHPNSSVDVAVIPMDDVWATMVKAGGEPYMQNFTREDAYSVSGDPMDALIDVGFIGYPAGLFDTSNFLPIARSGTTATPPYVDYCGEPAFLIDASVFGGSSGSPVYRPGNTFAPNRSGAIVLGDQRANSYILMGILAAVHTSQIDGAVVTVLPASTLVRVNEPIDLGIVYRAETIDVCVDLMLAKQGLSQVKNV
ncbi:MAG: hypothetical protein ACRCYU_21445 [Nocardioides sp.]